MLRTIHLKFFIKKKFKWCGIDQFVGETIQLINLNFVKNNRLVNGWHIIWDEFWNNKFGMFVIRHLLLNNLGGHSINLLWFGISNLQILQCIYIANEWININWRITVLLIIRDKLNDDYLSYSLQTCVRVTSKSIV